MTNRSPGRVLLAALTVLLLLAAACGGGDDDPRAAATRASPTPAAGEDGAPGETDDEPGQATTRPGDAGGNSEDGDPDRAEPTPTPIPTAPPGMVFPPRREHYVYDVSGERQTPAMSAPAAYPSDARLEWEQKEVIPIPGQSVEFVYKGRLPADDASFDLRIWFQREGHRYAHHGAAYPGGSTWSCRYAEPVAYLNFPVKAETYPTQSWTGAGCSGTTEVKVVGSEDVEDGQGRSWATWKVEEQHTYTMGPAQGTIELTRWIAADEGVDIRTVRVEEGVYRPAGVSAPRPYSFDQTLVLREIPQD